MCFDGILDKSNHPQLNNQNNVTIALQIQMRHRKKNKKNKKNKKKKKKKKKAWIVF